MFHISLKNVSWEMFRAYTHGIFLHYVLYFTCLFRTFAAKNLKQM